MILIYRIIADILWQFKFVGVIVNLVMLFFLVASLSNLRFRVHKKARLGVFLIGFLLLLIFTSLLREFTAAALIIWFKVSFSLLVFIYGTVFRSDLSKQLKRLGNLGVYAILFFLMISFFSFSYQFWGDSYTFNGIYYFKSDMAIAIVIFLSFVLIDRKRTVVIKIILSIVALYLIYLTNARIHILTSFFVVVLFLFKGYIFNNLRRKLIVLIPLFLALIVFVLLFYNKIAESGKTDRLKIELSSEDFFSEENSQGRSVIWASIMFSYLDAPSKEKLLGFNLTHDSYIVKNTLNREYNSHNSFLFLLISVGLLGLFIFLFFIFLGIKQILYLCDIYPKLLDLEKIEKSEIVLYLSICHLLIFIISSLTNSTIVFQQQTWFFMFFMGYCFNAKYIDSIS